MSAPPHQCILIPHVVPDHVSLLTTLLADVAWTSHMASRRTASMGVPYNYGGASYPVTPWHPAVKALANKLTAHLGFTSTNCLLNYYPTGRHTMGWHADDTTILAEGTGVGIVSLGATRTLKLRARNESGFLYENLTLEAGSLLLMPAAMQAHWRHAIKREDVGEARVSLSFRQIVKWPEVPPEVPPLGDRNG